MTSEPFYILLMHLESSQTLAIMGVRHCCPASGATVGGKIHESSVSAPLGILGSALMVDLA